MMLRVPNAEETQVLLGSIAAPDLPVERIAQRVEEVYGLTGEWKRLGGEREQNFRLTTADGNRFVVKIAAQTEPLESLMFQINALQHIERIDPEIPAPRVKHTLSAKAISSIADAEGRSYALRILTFVAGSTLLEVVRATGTVLGAEELMALGEMSGRLARAMQGFRGDGAPEVMPWDLANGLLFTDTLKATMPAEVSPVLQSILSDLRIVLSEQLPRLRAQVVYHDFHESNVLVSLDPSFRIDGIIDFGDMIFAPVVQDLSVTIASLIHWSADPVYAAGCLVRGFQRQMPLETEELEVLKPLVMARLLLQVGLVAHQAAQDGAPGSKLDELQSMYVDVLLKLHALPNEEFLQGMMPSVVPDVSKRGTTAFTPTTGLLKRREAVLGKTYTFYNEPLEIVRGKGSKLFDASGKEYLDCYNNVANLGHCHPYVVDALARQASTLNTNSRYLHTEIVRLGERLGATLPDNLDTWFFVCSGSEANDLAVQLSRIATGKDGIVVTENSYHGNTTTVSPLSLIDYDPQHKPGWVETVSPPNLYRGIYRDGQPDAGARYADHVEQAAERLDRRSHGMAGLMIDSIFDANGALVPPPDYLPRAYAAARTAGALTIADEVQMGFARSGTHMWGFEAFGVEPDIVTMGKPMGNGHPIAALVTRREIAELLQKRTGYFNTFGGNTVSAVVGNACLDVLIGENLQANAARSGAALKQGLEALMSRHGIIGHIHGRGLFIGVELVTDHATKAPAKLAARWVRERLKSLGVLVSSTGPFGNIIKIRPPLVFSLADVARCLETLDQAIAEIPADLRTKGL